MKKNQITTRAMSSVAVSVCLAGGGHVNGQVIQQVQKLAVDDAESEDLFGKTIAIDSGIIAVGSEEDDDNGSRSGSVYLYDASSGEFLRKLLPEDGRSFAFFGTSVDIHNGVVAVGARGDLANGPGSGAAYIFDASTGVQIAKLVPEDGMKHDFFGYSIAVKDGVVAVGAVNNDTNGDGSGAAYLFDLSGAQITKIAPDDGQSADVFGRSVAIDNGIVAIGANGYDGMWWEDSGAVYLFDVSTGLLFDQVYPNTTVLGQGFGLSVAMDDGLLVVGSSDSSFIFDVASGEQLFRLRSREDYIGDGRDVSVDIDNGVVVLGAPYHDESGSDSGVAYYFNVATGRQFAKVLPSDGASNDKFGAAVAIDNGVVVVGAYRAGSNGIDSGAGYVFDVTCPSDLTLSGNLNFFDVSAFLQAFSNQSMVADFTNDGVFDFFDISAFLYAYNAGCP